MAPIAHIKPIAKPNNGMKKISLHAALTASGLPESYANATIPTGIKNNTHPIVANTTSEQPPINPMVNIQTMFLK